VTSEVKHLPIKREALSSNPSTTKKRGSQAKNDGSCTPATPRDDLQGHWKVFSIGRAVRNVPCHPYIYSSAISGGIEVCR
jgi:hypothetical protein